VSVFLQPTYILYDKTVSMSSDFCVFMGDFFGFSELIEIAAEQDQLYSDLFSAYINGFFVQIEWAIDVFVHPNDNLISDTCVIWNVYLVKFKPNISSKYFVP